MLLCTVALAASLIPFTVVSPASATISSPVVLDGPGAGILDVDGSAMAADGSGGVIYRKLVEGQPHLFVSRFLNGTWQAPVQADVGQLGPATFPTIAAGDGGELLVTWVQPWTYISSTLHYELMSAVLQPGAQSFGQVERIDDVGDASAVYPSLAMASNGVAYVAYRVVVNPLTPGGAAPLIIQPMRPGDELIDVRVARFNGAGWSSVGSVNRLPGQVTMRKPLASNAPVVAVNALGQAIVVWQEPEIEGVARIWARRLFGTARGNVLAVSPASIGGKPVTVDADAPALAFNEYGAAEVAFRLAGGAGSPLGAPHVLLNTLTMPVAESVSSFSGAVSLAGGEAVGSPSVALDSEGAYRVSFTANGAAGVVAGAEGASGAAVTLGRDTGSAALVTVNPDGGGVTAWPAIAPSGLPAVEVHQDFPAGAWQAAFLTAPLSGPANGLFVGRSGLGDALVAFSQGPADGLQVMAALAQSPPGHFTARTPQGWVKARAAVVEWEPAPNAVGAVGYSVLVDGHVLARGLRGLSYKFDPLALGDGVRRVQVLAVDQTGQETMTARTNLRVDSNPPLVTVHHLRGGRIEVHVYERASGVRTASTLVSFGDGTTVTRRNLLTHAYRSSGRYTVVVHDEDRVGNRGDIHVLVQIP
jgi:hypothetical protein